jgi:hypothetical protein
VEGEKGIPIKYNPAVNVPLVSSVSNAKVTEPILNSTLEIQNPTNAILPENAMNLKGSTTGYYMMNGILTNGYIAPIGDVNGTKIHMTKVANITRGLSGTAIPHVTSTSYYAVFPNGNTVKILNNSAKDTEETAASKTIVALKGNPERVVKEANITTPISIVAQATTNEVSGASTTAQAEQVIVPHDDEFEDDEDLRLVSDEELPIWD